MKLSNEVQITSDTSRCWSWQNHGMLAEEGCKVSMESAQQRSVFQSTKRRGAGNLKSSLTSDVEMQFGVQMWFSSVGSLSSLFRMEVYILCHCEYVICLLGFDFTGG